MNKKCQLFVDCEFFHTLGQLCQSTYTWGAIHVYGDGTEQICFNVNGFLKKSLLKKNNCYKMWYSTVSHLRYSYRHDGDQPGTTSRVCEQAVEDILWLYWGLGYWYYGRRISLLQHTCT